ncbi:MAG TPA: CapA family protein [Anaerolineales bacterium]|nr:CapA family protein [Anaerolineales bacterium]
MKKIFLFLAVAVLAAACTAKTPIAPTPSATATATFSAPSVATPTPRLNGLWISTAVPDELRTTATGWGVPLVNDPASASMKLDVDLSSSVHGTSSIWIYALVAPFPTVTDGVSSDDLKAAWHGSSSGPFAGHPLWMADSTLAAFTALWGAPANGAVVTAPADQLVEDAWKTLPSWGIVPFESLVPKWKVLTVDGQSPIHKDFDAAAYPLQIKFALDANPISALSMPASNRDASKLTTVILTGTTSLVNAIAYQMEVNGIDYPAQDIGATLREADIVHVSNKTSFAPNCPAPNPDDLWPRCSDPKYIQLLKDVGVNVVELTGPHILDDGVDPFLFTLNLYKQNNIQYYGGGANLDEARQPLLIVNHRNKIAFMGCNAGEPPQPLATDYRAGANPCNYKQLAVEIAQVRAQGYLPIFTFQYKEGFSPQVMPWQLNDFQQVADDGAVIVSGSQSHVPLEMEFFKDTFIHYGLGNFFYDQMGNQPPDPTDPRIPLQPAQRWEFIDRHVIYDNHYISTELLTAMLEDYARPRPMTSEERAAFLTAYFGYSGWLPLIPTPAPEQTPTLYPLLNFTPLPTHTPIPKVTPTP